MFNPDLILGAKSRIFSVVLVCIISLLAIPIIIPHVLHGYHMIHIGIHITGITLSVFLSILAFLAYNNLKTQRMKFTLVAFLMFVSTEIVTLIDATWPNIYDLGPISLSEIGHILLITTLSLLSVGVFKND